MAASDRSRLSLCEPFAVAGYRVDPGLLQISSGDVRKHLEPKAMGVLCLLAANHGQTVSREQLFQAVWDGRVVVDESLTRAVSQLRHAFGDNPRQPTIFQTVPKIGYRLIAAVSLGEQAAERAAAPGQKVAWNKKTVSLGIASAAVVALVTLLAVNIDFRPSPPKNSLAVLPFVNMSGDESEEYLSDGMTEEILNALARVDGIQLVGRTSTFRLKNQRMDLREVGEMLGVENLLEGSVRRSGNRIRITVQMVNARDGYHVWSQVYDREYSDTFIVQQEIAEAIAEKLELSADQTLIAAERTDNLDAYTWYLKGNKLARDTQFKAAAAAFHEAIDLDPNFSPSYSRYVWACLSSWGVPVTRECQERAEPYMARAQQLNPGSADVDVGYALIYDILQKDFVASREALERALERDPDNTFALKNYAYALSVFWGEDERAIVHHKRVFRLEPLSFGTRLTYAWALTHLGRAADADRELRKLIAIDPDYAAPYMTLAMIKLTETPLDYMEGFRLLHDGMQRRPDAIPFAAAEASIDLHDFRAARYWADIISDAMPGSYYAMGVAFKLFLAQGDVESAYWVSRQMATLRTFSPDLEWNSMASVAWLRILQSQDPELAATAYVGHYPGLADERPVIAEWNYAAAIGYAALLRQQGREATSAQLLASVTGYLDQQAGQHPQARAAVAVLRGDLGLAQKTLADSIAGGNLVAWWLPEKDELFSPLWQEPGFQRTIATARLEIERHRAALDEGRQMGTLPMLPVSEAASRQH